MDVEEGKAQMPVTVNPSVVSQLVGAVGGTDTPEIILLGSCGKSSLQRGAA